MDGVSPLLIFSLFRLLFDVTHPQCMMLMRLGTEGLRKEARMNSYIK